MRVLRNLEVIVFMIRHMVYPIIRITHGFIATSTLLLATLLALLLTLTIVVGANAAPIELKLGHIANPQNPYGQGAEKLAALVAKKSKGEIIIKVFPSRQLGDQRELIEAVALGTVDMTLTNTAIFVSFVPEMAVFDLPFIFRDTNHAYKVLDTIGMEVAKKGESQGFKTLGFMENGVRHMTNNKRPIRIPADMKGLKMRVMDHPVYIEMMKTLGAIPIPMVFGELVTALKKGIINGQENTLAHIYASRLFEVQKYISLTTHIYSGQQLLISTVVWNKLSPAQQQILQESVAEAIKWQRNLCRQLEGEYIEKITASGKSTINDDVDKKAFAKATHSTWSVFSKSVEGTQVLIDSIVAVQ